MFSEAKCHQFNGAMEKTSTDSVIKYGNCWQISTVFWEMCLKGSNANVLSNALNRKTARREGHCCFSAISWRLVREKVCHWCYFWPWVFVFRAVPLNANFSVWTLQIRNNKHLTNQYSTPSVLRFIPLFSM